MTQTIAPYKRPSKVFIHAGDLPRGEIAAIRRPLVHRWLDDRDRRIGA